MKRPLLITLLLTFAGNVHAAALCDAACVLTISFPSGGSIEAVEAVEFRFGDGGLINTAGAVTAYVDGETLVLAAGDTITFGSGGHFDLGQAGNLDYTNLRIVTDGVMDLAPATAADSITFADNTMLYLSPDSTLRLSGKILNLGSLEVGQLVILGDAENPSDPPQCQFFTATDNSLTISADTIAATDESAQLATGELPDCSIDFDGDISAPLITLEAGILDGFGGTLIPVEISIDPNSTISEPQKSNDADEADDEEAAAADRAFVLIFLCLAWFAYFRGSRTGVT